MIILFAIVLYITSCNRSKTKVKHDKYTDCNLNYYSGQTVKRPTGSRYATYIATDLTKKVAFAFTRPTRSTMLIKSQNIWKICLRRQFARLLIGDVRKDVVCNCWRYHQSIDLKYLLVYFIM